MYKEYFLLPSIETREIVDQRSGDTYLFFRTLDNKFSTIFKWDSFAFDDDKWSLISESIKTLLHNKIKFEDKIYGSLSEVFEFINKNIPTYSPTEKLEKILEYVHTKLDFDGDKFDLYYEKFLKEQRWRDFYFANENEFYFYLDNLIDQGLINSNGKTAVGYLDLTLSITGLTRVLKILERKDSNLCFIAMSFSSELESNFENGIAPALSETGFIPYLVRMENIGSDITINDAIISGLKKCRFTIADFTEHKAGVYFEAGYALGRNQKVIYTCRKDEISKAHFDTRNYQHIVWENSEDLRKKLIDKINAYILD